MHTPFDKRQLPEPDYVHTKTDGWEGGTVLNTSYWNADTLQRLLADERRKALEEAKVAVSETVCSCCYSEDEQSVANSCVDAVQGLINRKEPTT